MASKNKMAQRRIRPTGMGWGFMLVVGLIFLLAVNHTNNLLFLFSFLLMGLLVVAFWFCWRNLAQIQGVCHRVESVHAGHYLNYPVVLEDSSGSSHYGLFFDEAEDNSLNLTGDDHQIYTLSVLAELRGMQASRFLNISSLWPLGFFRCSKVLCELPEVVVYPAANNVREVVFEQAGEEQHQKQAADSLAGLKSYQPGDNLRRVHWRALARNDQLQVREFDGETGNPSGWLSWDATQGLENEARISCLTHWVLDSHQRDLEFGLKVPGQQVTPNKGSQHLRQCLRQLALLPGEV